MAGNHQKWKRGSAKPTKRPLKTSGKPKGELVFPPRNYLGLGVFVFGSASLRFAPGPHGRWDDPPPSSGRRPRSTTPAPAESTRSRIFCGGRVGSKRSEAMGPNKLFFSHCGHGGCGAQNSKKGGQTAGVGVHFSTHQGNPFWISGFLSHSHVGVPVLAGFKGKAQGDQPF